MPAVRMVAVIGMPDRYHGEVVKACVVPRDANVSVDELRAHCTANLASYKVPVEIELRETLPQSAVGKILYRVLREGSWEEVTTKRVRTAVRAGSACRFLVSVLPHFQLDLRDRLAVHFVGAVGEAQRAWCAHAPAESPRSPRRRHAPESRDPGRASAIRGATTLICAISDRAALLPTVSIKCAARSVSSRA